MNDKQLIEDNLAVITEGGSDIMADFYATLFSRHAELEALFGRRSAVAQQKMVLHAILAVVGHLEDEGWLRGTLRPLGARHHSYGVTEAMYPMVAEALIDTLAKASGPHWNAKVEWAWTRALSFVAGEMMAGARVLGDAEGPATDRSAEAPASS